MSLVFCPECGHEISQNAVACPNCGRPINVPPVVEKRPPAAAVVPVRRQTVPPWAYALMAVTGILLIVILFLLFRGPGDDANVNVAMNARRQAEANREIHTANVPATESQTTTTVPQTSYPTTISNPPVDTTVPSTTTSAPVAPPPSKGTVAIRAQIVTSKGATQPARAARFYLLDKDVETILSEARVEPIEGNTLSASLGLAAVHPDQYPAFRQAAMRAIAAHTKYSGTTDTSGAARLANIAPKEYYLFAITRVGNGFALWNSPVSITAGDNALDLSPASVTEIEG